MARAWRPRGDDCLWKYVNVRRHFAFVERSMYQGTQWAVYEQNNEGCSAVAALIFLLTEWHWGTLLGLTAEEAYFGTDGHTRMTRIDTDNGCVTREIGIAPVTPSEFVIF